MHNDHRGLAFLLSLGSLPLACAKEDDGEPGAPTSGTASGSTTTTGSEATESSPISISASTTTSASETQPTTSMTSDPNTSSETGSPGATDPICIAYARHIVECFPRYAMSETYIAQNCELYKGAALRTNGQPCADALDASYVCISELDCAELVKGEPPSGCQAETAAVMAACGHDGPDTDASDSATDTVGDSNSSTG